VLHGIFLPHQSALEGYIAEWCAAHSLAPIILVLENVQHIIHYFQSCMNSFTQNQHLGSSGIETFLVESKMMSLKKNLNAQHHIFE
jgi:hypothetical protein